MTHDQQPDLYDILGVRRTATPEEIRQAYRKAMRAVHPDANGTSGLFRMVKTAYDTLSDPGARASYDAGGRKAPPPPEPPRPEPPPPGPPPRPEPGAATRQPPRSTPETARPERPASPVGPARTTPGSGTRVRPRFGAHWVQIAVVAAWTAAFTAAAYALWPTAVPGGLYLLLVLPVAAAPLIAAQPAVASRSWIWAVCAVPFAGGAALAASETTAARFWPYCGVLSGLALGAAGLVLAPLMLRHGRELDRLVGPDCLDHEIFNTPGAGLTMPGARDVARISGARLEGLAVMPGVRIIHGLAPPSPDGSDGYVAHALLRDDRLALVTARELAGDGIAAVQAFRTVVPRGVRVRGFVALVDGASGGRPPRTGSSDSDDLFTGSVSQVHAELAAWLEPAAPVIRRRTLAVLLGHVLT